MKRQAKGKMDLVPCSSRSERGDEPPREDFRTVLLYNNFFEPLILGKSCTRRLSHAIVWVIAIILVGGGLYGITESFVGVGLEDFFPESNPGYVWAAARTEDLAAWNIGMRWGSINYTDPRTQMKMMQQFENVVDSPRVTPMDTDDLWIGNFLIWTSSLCDSNFGREDFESKLCGHDKVFTNGETCSATWTRNSLGLKDRYVPELSDTTCVNFYGGICRKGSDLHPADILRLDEYDPTSSYCPTVEGWSDEQWQFCLVEWRKSTGFDPGFAFAEDRGSPTECSGEYENDQEVVWPLPISASPLIYGFDMPTHADTVDFIRETRAFCDDDEEVECWLYGPPYDYWSQYDGIYRTLFTYAAFAISVGSVISFAFLFVMLLFTHRLPFDKVMSGALVGALLILAPMTFSFLSVVGLSSLAGVNLTGFSNMAYVLSVGFSVEYAVHIVARWLLADQSILSSLDRVKHTMSFLMLPTFMSFVSSVIGVCCLAFTAFSFNEKFFFRPLIIVMLVTYFFGCWWLPTFLCGIEGGCVRVGPDTENVKTPERQQTTDTAETISAVDSNPEPRAETSNDVVVPEDVINNFNPERFEL